MNISKNKDYMMPNHLFDFWMLKLANIEFLIMTLVCKAKYNCYNPEISVTELAKGIGKSKETIKKYLRSLYRKKLITKTENGCYELNEKIFYEGQNNDL